MFLFTLEDIEKPDVCFFYLVQSMKNMRSFGEYFLHLEYSKIAELGNKPIEIRDIIDWEKFCPILIDMYQDNKVTGGRPHNDETVMIKMLVLASWHGLSDYEVDLLVTDRLSFRHFLGYPEKILDLSTVWLFRENLTTKGKIHLIWEGLQRQLNEKGDSIKRGTIQDASFITADPGHAHADKPRGDAAKTKRSQDGSWAKKGSISKFGYKLYSLIDKEYQFIRRFDTSTVSLYDRLNRSLNYSKKASLIMTFYSLV